MDDERKSYMDSKSDVLEESNNELDEKEQESQPFHVTPEKSEVIESNGTATSFSCEKDPEALETIHKYASRVKSFLGWDSGSEESEIVKNLDELIDSSGDTSSITKLDENIDDSQKLKEMNENLPSLVEFCCNPEKDKTHSLQNGEKSNRDDDQLNERNVINFHKNAERMQSEEKCDVITSESLSPHTNNRDEIRNTCNPEKSNSVENIQNMEYSTAKESPKDENSSPTETRNGNLVKNNNGVVDILPIIDRVEEYDDEKNFSITLSTDKVFPENKESEKVGEENFARNSSAENISVKSVSESENDDINETEKGNSAEGSNNITSDTVEPLDSVFYENDTNGKDSLKYKGNIFVTEESLRHEESLIDPDTVCGFGCFKPKCIQKLATPKSFLIFFGLVGVIQASYYTYFVGMITTLEKRYAFPSKISGTVLLSDELIPALFGTLVGYIGDRTHRPRMTALGMLMSVICCFISAFPYFIYGSANSLKVQNSANTTDMQYCDIKQKDPTCNESDQKPTVAVLVVLLIGSLLKGVAALSYHVVGIPYMDDITAKKTTSLYLAISLALRFLGPLLGYVMSFVFLKVYENPFEDPGFGPEDPRWIGAWWLGFCVQGVLLFICTIPIALFPRRMPGQRKQTQIKEETLKEMLSGLGTAMTRLAKNPVFIFLTINTVVTVFGHFGHAIMLPKYMENQFRLSASDASLFSGVTSVGCMIFSTLFGGFLIWKFKPRAKMLLGGMVASEIIMAIGFLLLTVPRCQEVEMTHYGMNNEGFILDSVCNVNCNCSTTSFTPFCGPDGKTSYFSPCHAGCTELNTSMLSKRKVFGNCSCVADALGNTGGQITEGFCPDENCWNQAIAYIIILLIVIIVGKTLTVAHTIILLRSVHPNDKSFALGTFEAFICLLGLIPAPVTLGALVDSACLVWEKSCDQTGNCWFYDMEKYNYLLHIVSAIFSGFSVICLIILYFLNSRIRSLYEDEEDEKVYEDIKLDTVSGSVTKL